jgi:hypothetical protein
MTSTFTDYAIWKIGDSAYTLGKTEWNIRWAGTVVVLPSGQVSWVPLPGNMNNVSMRFDRDIERCQSAGIQD